MSEIGRAASLLAAAADWCDRVAPIFSPIPNEQPGDWMERMIEHGLAARSIGADCIEVGCDFGPWERCRWRPDRARRVCTRCGLISVSGQPLRRFGFDVPLP